VHEVGVTPEYQRRFTAFVAAAVAVCAAALALVLVRQGADAFAGTRLVDLFVLCVLAIIAEVLAVEFADRVTVTAANLPILLAMVFLGPAQAMIVAAVAGLWACWRETSVRIAAFNAANYVLPALLGSLAFQSLQNNMVIPLDRVTPQLLLGGAVAAGVYELTNLGTAGIGMFLAYGRPARVYWKDELGPFLRSLVMLTGVGLMVMALYALAGIVAVVVLFLPLFASQYIFQLLVREKQHLARQKKLTEQYLEMNIGLAAAMIVLLDSKDHYTARHCAAVAMYCRDMAKALGLPESQVEALHLAGLLHDLGKVGTPDAVLGKQGKLDEGEWEFIHEHPMKGAEVLSHLVAYRDVADIVQYHHERLDGSGYPLGVHDDEIPESAKILAVADSYHAMTSDRPYRRAMSSFEALKVLRQNAGKMYEALYVETLGQILRDKDLAYRDGTSTDFMDEYERGRINLRLHGSVFEVATDGQPIEAEAGAPASG
jgi:putative nucleotidyltransferase with HDIG domain